MKKDDLLIIDNKIVPKGFLNQNHLTTSTSFPIRFIIKTSDFRYENPKKNINAFDSLWYIRLIDWIMKAKRSLSRSLSYFI